MYIFAALNNIFHDKNFQIVFILRNGYLYRTAANPGPSFFGWTRECRIYNREINQTEVKTLTTTSVAQTLPVSATNVDFSGTIDNVYFFDYTFWFG
jgi:hypothetical protein